MKPDELDRILSKADEIMPSSGFTANVMDAVQREFSAPPPIPFPWRRAVPGFGVAGRQFSGPGFGRKLGTPE